MVEYALGMVILVLLILGATTALNSSVSSRYSQAVATESHNEPCGINITPCDLP
jgi:hypothetical protein